MSVLNAFVFIVLAFASRPATAIDLIPNVMQSCPADLPQLTQCLRQSIVELMSVIGTGNAQLQLPSINPLRIAEILLTPKSSSIKIFVKSADIYNLQNVSITDFQVVEHGHRYKVEVAYPQIDSTFAYNMNGELMFLKLKGRGHGVAHFYRVTSAMDVRIEHQPNAEGILTPVMRMQSIIAVRGGGNIKLDGLPSAALSEAVHAVINDNFDVLAKDFLPSVQKRCALELSKYANQFLGQFSSAEMFPGLKL